MFIEDDQGESWALSLDDEDNTWRLRRTPDIPEPGTIDGDDEFRYPTTDLLNRFPIGGDAIREFTQADIGAYARARFDLSSGRALILDYEYATERSTITLEEAG